jgi:uncharacterized protein HemX
MSWLILLIVLPLGLAVFFFKKDRDYLQSELADTLNDEMKQNLNIKNSHSHFDANLKKVEENQKDIPSRQILKKMNQKNSDANQN